MELVLQNVRGGLTSASGDFCIREGIDVLLLVETWMLEAAPLPNIPGFSRSYGAARPGTTSRLGSNYGGIAIYIRNDLVGEFSVWIERPEDGVLWLQRRLPGFSQYWGCCYIAPDGCGGCPSDVEGWFERLEEEITTARESGEVLVAGDFNARVSTLPDFCEETSLGPDCMVEEADMLTSSVPRQSIDQVVTRRGRILLEMCKVTGLRIFNGRTPGDIPATATSLGHGENSRSVIDLIMVCPTILSKTLSLRVGAKLLPTTDHLSVALRVEESSNMVEEEVPEMASSLPLPPEELQVEYVWEVEKTEAFRTAFFKEDLVLRRACILEEATVAAAAKNVPKVAGLILELLKQFRYRVKKLE